MSACADVDCEAGRAFGCRTYCCRLLVRLDADERRHVEGEPTKGFVDKDPEDGLCVNLDRTTFRCRIWAERPRVCRAFDCNTDPLLQVAVRLEFRSIVDLVTAAACAKVRPEQRVRVPSMAESIAPDRSAR